MLILWNDQVILIPFATSDSSWCRKLFFRFWRGVSIEAIYDSRSSLISISLSAWLGTSILIVRAPE